MSSRNPAASIDFRRLLSPTWNRCFSAPLLRSKCVSLSSKTSIGVCAFQRGISVLLGVLVPLVLLPLPVVPGPVPVDPGYQDPARDALFCAFSGKNGSVPFFVFSRVGFFRRAALAAAAAAAVEFTSAFAEATQPVRPSPTHPSTPPISTTPASSSVRDGRDTFSDGGGIIVGVLYKSSSPNSSFSSSSSSRYSGLTPDGLASTGELSLSHASALPNNNGPGAFRGVFALPVSAAYTKSRGELTYPAKPSTGRLR